MEYLRYQKTKFVVRCYITFLRWPSKIIYIFYSISELYTDEIIFSTCFNSKACTRGRRMSTGLSPQASSVTWWPTIFARTFYHNVLLWKCAQVSFTRAHQNQRLRFELSNKVDIIKVLFTRIIKQISWCCHLKWLWIIYFLR